MKILTNILMNFDFSVDFSLTYNLLTVANFRIGVPSILFIEVDKIETEREQRTKEKRFQESDVKYDFWDTQNFSINY
jgi:hypothetical protein